MTINASCDHMLSFQRQMIAMNGLGFLQHLSIISDPRQQWKVEHKLSVILFLTIVAVIGGAEGWEEIEDFGVDHLDWLRQYGDFENGVPVHDTIARVMGMLSATQLQNWQLDVGMREDDCREQAGENTATIRHIAFNALKGDTSFKARMKRNQQGLPFWNTLQLKNQNIFQSKMIGLHPNAPI